MVRRVRRSQRQLSVVLAGTHVRLIAFTSVRATTLRAFLIGLISLSLAACSPPAVLSQAEQAVQTRLPSLPFLHRGSTPSASVQSAVKLVIQRGDFEQEQAVARGDSSVMKDTSTDGYFRQAQQQNQDLRDSGVKSIKLVGIDWGSMTQSGNTVTVTAFETWSTQYGDGSTDQSRDRNVYTLVQQNGVWKIDKDEQPDNEDQASPSDSGRISPAASSAPAPSTQPSGSPRVTAAAGTPQAAIEQVILRGNSEQEQAIANKDSSVMKDTSTGDYYQDLSQTNQDMIDAGVTAIKLVGLQWGNISINGNTATATTTETWRTDYSDGSTDQSSDRNVYTLTQDNGSWKIQSDDHPDEGLVPAPAPASSPAPSGASPSPRVPPQPIAPRGRGQSANWSGYAANGGKFTEVDGTWTVPQPSTGGSLGADAAWIGIGGENSHDLIQAGTEETVLSSGRVRYDAWIEMLPQYSHPVPLAVHAGDSVSVSIKQQDPGTWQISFKNNTSGATYDRTVQYQSSLSSAEWIEEAPSGGRGGVMPIDNFGSIAFSSTSAVKDGQKVNLSQAGASPITMINANGQPLVTPSAVTADGSGFNVSRTSNAPTVSTGRRRIGSGF